MSNTRIEVEHELAYEWMDVPQVVETLPALVDWDKIEAQRSVIDTIYDTVDSRLSEHKMGVRVRTVGDVTTLTAKRFIEHCASGENKFEEQHIDLPDTAHPTNIGTENGLTLPKGIAVLQSILEFDNQRHIFTFTKDAAVIKIINEDVSYADQNRAVQEFLLEIEFTNVDDVLIKNIKTALEQQYKVKQIQEGKTDRAKRLLSAETKKPLIQNLNDIMPLRMSAHGGTGEISMQFFHQPYNHFAAPGIRPKVVGYQKAGWDFFAYAELPVGAEVKEHLHDSTDEIYFILEGAATLTVDGVEQILHKGDCVLTRKGSRHSLTNVTETLHFIATETLARE